MILRHPRLRWSSVNFDGRIPHVTITDYRGVYVGDLRFSSWKELKELANTLLGAAIQEASRHGNAR